MKFSDTGINVGGVTIGINDFVRRQTETSIYSYFRGTFEEVVALAKQNLADATIVQGDKNNARVLLVNVDARGFFSSVVCVDDVNVKGVKVSFEARRPDEERAIKLSAPNGMKKEATVVELILYSKEALAEGNEATTNCDYELVSINAGLIAYEPMHPLTMARNFLVKTGGTKADYTAEQFAEAIWYWKDKIAGQ